MNIKKKIVSLIMALAVMVTMIIVPDVEANAAADSSIIINTQDEDTSRVHTYTAYQIFDGTISTGNVISNIEWGADVDGDKLLTALKTVEFGGNTYFASCASAEDVAKVLRDHLAGNDEYMDLFAQTLKYGTGVLKTSGHSASSVNGTCTISELEAGYYFVDEATAPSGDNSAATRFIVNVTSLTAINAKPVHPTITKEFDASGSGKKTNTASIGDTVTYVITSAVPDMTGYEKYFFVVDDTLSKGLDFNNDIVIKLGDTTLINNGSNKDVKNTGYYVEKGTDGDDTTLKIVFDNFIQYKADTGKAITITYTATLNEKAVIGNTGNPNTVKLTYSNNPNVIPSGTNEPTGGDPKGVTPEQKVITYTYQIKLKKVDGANNVALQGAKFTISGTGLKKTEIIKDVFTVNALEGTYYKLVDGTFTTDGGQSSDKYYNNDNTTKYKKETVTSIENTADDVSEKGEVGTDGILCFEELGNGTFTITETDAPDGYNKIEPFKVTIADGKYSILDKDGNDLTTPIKNVVIGADGIIEYTVVNNKGVVLPSTGGIGTKIFYMAGGIMVLAAAVLLITKKRMERE